ncbi:MAG: PEGA domain-containing protein [Candidatus Acidiferrales bacterium]
MRIRSVVGLFLLLILAFACSAQEATDASSQRAILQQILTQTYPPSEVGKRLMGVGKETEVRRPGGIVVIQRAGLFGSFERNEIASSAIHGLDASVFRGHQDYPVPAGERFYVTSIFVGQSTVMIGLLSAHSVPSPKGAARVWTAASFYFPDKTLADADKNAVLGEIDAWFMLEGRAAAAVTPAAPLASPVALAPATVAPVAAAPAAPIPVPAAAPTSLNPGMSREEIFAALGKPQREVTFQGQTWLYYPGMIALLKDGKLASMEQSGPASATLAVGSEPAGAEIYVDGQLLSSTPATFEVTAGNHQLLLKLAGYQDWTRSIHVLPAGAIHFEPTLEMK